MSALAMRRGSLLKHRGPDYCGIWDHVCSRGTSTLTHTRLAIVDPGSGNQPLLDSTEKVALAVNGEIYNHTSLRNESMKFYTASDCEIIMRMHIHTRGQNPTTWLNRLRGMFAFVLYDYSNKDKPDFLIARDPIGIIPLYYGYDICGGLWVVSEMKAFPENMKNFDLFPPGSYMTAEMHSPVKYYNYDIWSPFPSSYNDPGKLYSYLERAVVSHMMTDVPFGTLLSGGLDSSIITALACRHSTKRIESGEKYDAWFPQIHTFSVGLKNSPDLACAKMVSNHLNTVHHEIIITVEEAIRAIQKVIYHTETYDCTTIRSSTPMTLMAKKIRAMGFKMILSGEGADEIFGGYLYFSKAPSPVEFHHETVRKVKALPSYDNLRANKSMMTYGIECRPPFLDTEFVEYAMNLDPALKMCNGVIEKKLLRDTFGHLLPDCISNRQKEQFSDGVGYNWIDSIKAYAEKKYGDRWKDTASKIRINSPRTPEELLYREYFDEFYPTSLHANTVPWGSSIACSTPAAIEWDSEFKKNADPSGRAICTHLSTR